MCCHLGFPYLGNLLKMATPSSNRDVNTRRQAAVCLFNSIHNVLESTALAIKHIPELGSIMRAEDDDFALFKLIGCIHDVVELHGDTDPKVYKDVLRERVWEAESQM